MVISNICQRRLARSPHKLAPRAIIHSRLLLDKFFSTLPYILYTKSVILQITMLNISVEACDIITFGRSSKKSYESHLIGMYGNGLKS